jgi:hypothetical protein
MGNGKRGRRVEATQQHIPKKKKIKKQFPTKEKMPDGACKRASRCCDTRDDQPNNQTRTKQKKTKRKSLGQISAH